MTKLSPADAMETGQTAVAQVAIQIGSALHWAARRRIVFTNTSGQSVYISNTAAVTTATGWELPSGAVVPLLVAQPLWAISDAGTNTVSWLDEINH